MKDEFIFTPFYLSFSALCKRDKLTPTEAAKRAGISSGAPTAWKKKGAIPRPEQLKKLCALFNVSEQEMLGYSAQKEKPAPGERGGLTEEQMEIVKLFDGAPDALRAAALAVLRSAEGQGKVPGGVSKAE